MEAPQGECVVFSRAQAQQLGISWRRKGVHTVFPGIYTLADPTRQDVRLEAAQIAAGSAALFAGATALRLRGAWLPEPLASLSSIQMWLPLAVKGPRLKGLRVYHTTRLFDPQWAGPWLCLNPLDAFLQVVADEDADDAVVTLDSLMCRKRALVSVSELRLVLDKARGLSGIRALRKAASLAMPGTDSVMETRTRLALLREGLPCPVVNHRVQIAGKNFYLDMAYVDAKVAVEYDGAVHVESRAHMDRDRHRRRALEDAGWRVITLTRSDLESPGQSFVSSVRAALFSTH
jgi:very-short-patch-repair endonuclease